MTETQKRAEEVCELLAATLAEVIGPEITVGALSQQTPTMPQYCFDAFGASCWASATELSERAAGVIMFAKLGRCYIGYRRALHWLACNRAGNTVAAAAPPELLDERALAVCAHRVTLPGDAAGLREMLSDFLTELHRLQSGLCWFPQMLSGAFLRLLEERAEADCEGYIMAVLSNPAVYCDWLAANPDADVGGHGFMATEAHGWVGRWEEKLKWNERLFAVIPQEGRAARQQTYLLEKAHCLCELRRFEEMLATAEELDSVSEPTAARDGVTLRLRALFGLGRHEELLETVRSAEFDSVPRVHFWRSLAHTACGRMEEAAACFQQYEAAAGVDIIGRRELIKLLPNQDE
jgi:hypothetical protein